jgi:hypothetical protein
MVGGLSIYRTSEAATTTFCLSAGELLFAGASAAAIQLLGVEHRNQLTAYSTVMLAVMNGWTAQI